MGNLGGESSTTAKSASIFLQIVEHPDGTITRPFIPEIPATGLVADAAVLSRDLPLNSSTKTSLRLYLPPSSSQKVPLLLFFHGGGFVLFNSASAPYHLFCEQMAQSLSAIILSVDYRLAPEHRLPAAYDDALEAILWLQSQAIANSSDRDPWLADHADFNRLILAGSSSGANIVYHAALRAADLNLQPLKIAGIVFNQPYFGGEERTLSEAKSEEDAVLPLRANDMMWRLALPVGTNRDHEYSNPSLVMAADMISRMTTKCLVKCSRGDPLIDRQREIVRLMVAAGVSVAAQLEDEGFHAIELFDPLAAEEFFADVKKFIEA